MDIRHLRHILQLADDGHFGRAAERLHITQSALTRSIQTAEDELGLQLFDRGRGRVRLTRAGEMLARDARLLVRQMEALERNMALLARGEAGEVRCGLGPLLASLLLPDVLAEFARDHRHVRIATRLGDISELQRLLRDGEVDFAILSLPQLAADDGFGTRFVQQSLGVLALAALVRKEHPLAGQQAGADDLAAYPMIGGTPPAGLDASLYQPTIACDNYDIARTVTLASDAIWITAEALAGTEFDLVHGVAVAGRFQVVIATLADRTLPPSARLVIDNMAALFRRKWMDREAG